MVFPFLVIRLKSGMYIQIPQKKQIINADWLRWVGDDMLSIYIVFLISLRSTYGMQAYLSAPPRYCSVSCYIWSQGSRSPLLSTAMKYAGTISLH